MYLLIYNGMCDFQMMSTREFGRVIRRSLESASVHGHMFLAKTLDSDLDATPSEKAGDPLT